MSDTKPSEPQKLITFLLSVDEAQAILNASYNLKEELKPLKDKGTLSVPYRIIWDVWESGHKRMSDQYFNFINKE